MLKNRDTHERNVYMCKFSVAFLTKFDDEDDQDSYKSHSIKAFQNHLI